MFGLPPSVQIYFSVEPADMRKGLTGLSALVQAGFEIDLYSGHLFVFLSRRRDRVKILWWDRGGFVLYYKRLERGRFRRPQPGRTGNMVVTPAELQSLLEGIDLSKAGRTRFWEPTPLRRI